MIKLHSIQKRCTYKMSRGIVDLVRVAMESRECVDCGKVMVGRKIAAIRALRQLHSLDLREAKLLVETIAARPPLKLGEEGDVFVTILLPEEIRF